MRFYKCTRWLLDCQCHTRLADRILSSISPSIKASQTDQLFVELSSICDESYATEPVAQTDLLETDDDDSKLQSFEYTVTLKSAGTFLVQICTLFPSGEVVYKNVDLPYRDPLLWILKIGVPCTGLERAYH